MQRLRVLQAVGSQAHARWGIPLIFQMGQPPHCLAFAFVFALAIRHLGAVLRSRFVSEGGVVGFRANTRLFHRETIHMV